MLVEWPRTTSGLGLELFPVLSVVLFLAAVVLVIVVFAARVVFLVIVVVLVLFELRLIKVLVGLLLLVLLRAASIVVEEAPAAVLDERCVVLADGGQDAVPVEVGRALIVLDLARAAPRGREVS